MGNILGSNITNKDFMIYFFKFEYLFDLKSRIKPQAQEYGKGYRSSGDTEKGIWRHGKRTQRKNESKSKTKLRTKTGSIAGLETKSKTEPEYEDIDVSVSEENFYEASLLIEFFKLIASGAAILIGAKYFVEHAVFFALLLEDPETLIGISLVAVGTSVPKLIVTVSAADSHLAFDYFLCLLVIGSRASSSKIFLIRKRIISPSSARKLYADY